MRWIDSTTVESSGSMSNHRSRDNAISFRKLLRGQSDRPDNYEFSLIDMTDGYTTPRHRHNFDQLHYVVAGTHSVSPDQNMDTGSVGYYPEGTAYGPQQGHGNTQLALQFGGASGAGFLDYETLTATSRALEDEGTFDGGLFKWTDETGKPHQSDGYEAIWARARGTKPSYPAPRYDRPIIMRPDGAGWIAIDGEPGVAERHLGSFGERGLRVAFVRLDVGATHTLKPVNATTLWWIDAGSIDVDGTTLATGTAIEWSPGETATVSSPSGATLYTIRLHQFAASA
jgi:hypothetical protein